MCVSVRVCVCACVRACVCVRARAFVRPNANKVAVNVEQLFARLAPQYLDPELVTIVTGGVPETTALLRERFDHICYTGNGFVGKIVHQVGSLDSGLVVLFALDEVVPDFVVSWMV